MSATKKYMYKDPAKQKESQQWDSLVGKALDR